MYKSNEQKSPYGSVGRMKVLAVSLALVCIVPNSDGENVNVLYSLSALKRSDETVPKSLLFSSTSGVKKAAIEI